MATYRFEEVKLSGTKRFVCSSCGKRRSLGKTFSQTINPVNKNSRGVPKSRKEIMSALVLERESWLNIEELCAGCRAG